MKSQCAPISSGSRKASRKAGRSTIGCKLLAASLWFIGTQLTAMQRLFAEGDIAVLSGSATEDLSGNEALVALQPIDVGTCQMGNKYGRPESLPPPYYAYVSKD
jgi:hypothetical protein